jgi:hypothetical protein
MQDAHARAAAAARPRNEPAHDDVEHPPSVRASGITDKPI